MFLDDWAYRGSHNFYDNRLKRLATDELAPEKWDYAGNNGCPILRNYIMKTFEKLHDEKTEAEETIKNDFIYEDDMQACFNTGLLDKTWQPVYFYCKPNNRRDMQKWMFNGFYNSYTLKYTDMPSQAANSLRRPNYFNDPGRLVFDVKLPIFPQWNHILDDPENFNRIPEFIRLGGRLFCQNAIQGAINGAAKRIEANYKTAVPQWYKGQIQLLVPLYLTNPSSPDLALVTSLSEDKTQYFGHTCLTIDMAYSNARLIARPDSYWLNP
ncbi:MAG: DUF3825 domain-containing protein [Oscillospiraceae bacterium]|nr:DUF3825 domain-containing protein [Oscillospiraceae bacterium]